MKIKRVLIDGGTHGNELIGIYLIKKFERHPELVQRSGFETLTLLGNPKAIEAGIRYINTDLNRCFDSQLLMDVANYESNYEISRAREICAQFGQEGQTPVDVSINLHGTTANMGSTLILDTIDAFTRGMAAYLSLIEPTLKIYSSASSGRRHDSLRSLAHCGVGLEVGPVAHGTLHAEWFQQTEALVYAILDYLERYNSSPISPQQNLLEHPSLTVYQYAGVVDYPRDKNGEIQAMIHPQLQFKDYEALNPGDPIFLTFDGEAIAYLGDSTVYPIFINEAAYYEKGIAMCLTEKQQF